MSIRLDVVRRASVPLICCALALTAASSLDGQSNVPAKPDAISLSGKMLYRPPALPNQQKLEADLEQARKSFAENKNDPEAMIWIGRRYGYLWRFNEAIEAFTIGIERWPDNPKFYRHRGHRYITVRQFAKAQADFEKAAAGTTSGSPDICREITRARTTRTSSA